MGRRVLSNQGLLPGVKNINLNSCEHCVLGKQKRVSFKLNDKEKDYKILYLIYSDVCGPMSISTFGGASYFVTFIDHASIKLWVYLIKSKDQVLKTFKKFHKAIERETERPLKCI